MLRGSVWKRVLPPRLRKSEVRGCRQERTHTALRIARTIGVDSGSVGVWQCGYRIFGYSVDAASEVRGGDDEAQMNWGISHAQSHVKAPSRLLRHLERLRRDITFQLNVRTKVILDFESYHVLDSVHITVDGGERCTYVAMWLQPNRSLHLDFGMLSSHSSTCVSLSPHKRYLHASGNRNRQTCSRLLCCRERWISAGRRYIPSQLI
jgi:hypothetical protein